MHHVASSYASSVTGASAYDDALAAVAAAEARSPSTDRHRTPLQDALAHLGTAEGGGGMQQGRALFGEAASPTALPSVATGSPPEHAPRPASGGWRPMDAEAERESRVAAIRAEFRAVAQSVGALLARWMLRASDSMYDSHRATVHVSKFTSGRPCKSA